MRSVWTGPLLPVALAGLTGQGVLLLIMGGDPDRIPSPVLGLFLASVLALAVALAVPRAAGADSRGQRSSWLNPRLLLVILVLALQTGLLVRRLADPDPGPGDRMGPQVVAVTLDRAESALEDLLQQLVRMEVELQRLPAAASERQAGLFGAALAVRDDWGEKEAARFPLEIVIWSGDQRVAWTPGAMPLARIDSVSGVAVPAAGRHLLAPGRDGWLLQDLVPLGSDQVVEMQVMLPGLMAGSSALQVSLSVVTPRKAAQLKRIHQDQGRVVDLVPGGGESVVWLVVKQRPVSETASRDLFLLLLVLGWVLLVAVCVTDRPAGKGGLVSGLAAAWVARAVLARLDIFSRLASIFPDVTVPAAPGSWFSLLDPAYFATPVMGGWLASTADALLTATLLLGTVMVLWRAVRGHRAAAGLPVWRPGLGLGPGAGFVFGLIAALGLLGVAGVSGLVSTNANARLIGTGVPLSSLSFWALHLVLMMASVALVYLLGILLLTWPSRSCGQGVRAVAAAMALLGALAVVIALPGVTLAEGILAVLLAGIFWLGVPMLAVEQRFLRRLGLPALLLMVVVWNHTVLRELGGHAERRWLQNKAEAITTADEGWTRFLLGSILEDMQAHEDRLEPVGAATDIWRDEPAWRLWRGSALEDLGGACLVELLDARGIEESLMTRGFLRDFQYEVSRRSRATDREGNPATDDQDMTFQTELRLYGGGEEQVMIGEIPRTGGAGWIRVEIPLRSWRISTLQARLNPAPGSDNGYYRPRVEVGRPVLLVRGDDTGWLQASDNIFPASGSDKAVADLKSGRQRWAEIRAGTSRWLCLWQPLPPEAAHSPGEGFLIGLQQPGLTWELLDLSRLMLLNLVFLFVLQGLMAGAALLNNGQGSPSRPRSWRPGFQERFLGGYLLLGLVLLLVVGMSVDRVGYQAVRREARTRTREGLSLAVEQLRSLLVEQARSLAGSEYIADMLLGQLAGRRPVGPVNLRQAMVFAGDGTLLLDETLSDLDDAQARALLEAGRAAPLVIIRNEADLYVGTVIPIDLTDILAAADTMSAPGRGAIASDGFFFYRQRLDEDLLVGLADLVRGEATLVMGGRPVLASHPEEYFSGRKGRLAAPGMMVDLLSHPGSPGIFAASNRPFAFTGARPLPAFAADDGHWERYLLPAVLALSFPDREREFTVQRTENVLFLTGLANLILLTALALAGVLAWNIFRPLRVLAEATRSLAAGDFQAPLPEPGHDEVGELTAAFGTMRSQLHSARERLAAREQFLTTVLDRVPVGVGVMGVAGELVVLNPAGRRILAEFAPGEEPAVALAGLGDRLADQAVSGELRGADGRRTVRGAVAPLDLPGGRRDTMVVFEDITDFLANKKLALSAELARQVAHEIKNPLTPIQLSAQLLGQAWRDRHSRLDQIVPETVQRILDQVDLLRRIASEFSLLGRPDQMDLQPVDLENLVRKVVTDYTNGGETGEAGTVRAPVVELAEVDVPPVMANPESLQKILGNLMQNSLDAAVEGSPARVEVTWRWDERSVTLLWRDYGMGIPAEVAEHLFDPYFSTKSKGTGLGLAICRSLVDRMGGSITLENNPDGTGAVASLTLRRAAAMDLRQDESGRS